MTNYRYLGYGVTNENGVAHLEYDEDGEPLTHSYTGVGAGEIDVLASLDNPIVEGSIVSVPCNVLDCLKYDGCTISNHNDIWDTSDPNLTFERKTDYTSIKQKVTTSRATTYLKNIDTSGVIEFEMKHIKNGTVYASDYGLNFINDSTYCGFFSATHLGITNSMVGDWLGFKVIFDGTTYDVVSLDYPDKSVSGRTTTAPINGFMFSITANSDVSELQIRNIKVYPI